MKIYRKVSVFLLAFTMMLSLVPQTIVQATIKDVKIVSDTEVTAKDASKWAKSKGASQQFIDLAELFWKYSSKCGGVNPGIAYVQSAKETGYGNFGGVIDASYHNTCGLKTNQGGGNYDPNAHQKFNTWDEGVQAHLDHLALYAGADGYPKRDTYDSRHFTTIAGKAPTLNELGGKWAPSLTYGEEVNKLYRDLLDYAGVEEQSTDDENDKNTDEDNDDSSLSGEPNPATPENKPSALTVKEELTTVKADQNNSQYSTVSITSTIGWKNEDGNWYYYKSDNTKAKGWIKPDNNWYYLKPDGKMATAWTEIQGQWYYLNKSGAMVTGWIQLNNSWYYLKDSGQMVTGSNRIDNKNYLFYNNGSMAIGWINLNNSWYYFNVNGNMLTGWITTNQNYYYLYDTGAMAKGWINLNGAWYYLKENGAMAKGLVNFNKDWYYLEKNTGRMLTNTTIDGYKIGSNGKAKKISNENNNKPTSPSDSSSNNNTSNGSKTIVVDAGHNYGGDYGAETTLDGVKYSETLLNMQVASKLKTQLENKGYNVIMTRTEDQRETLAVGQSLANRVNKANGINADFFVSIHHNSATEAAKGIETYYSSNPQDAAFAGNVNGNKLSLSKSMATIINNKIVNNLNAVNRGGKNANLFVCRNTSMPAVLVEVGFITNREEAQRCANPQSQQLVAEAIAEAIAENI